MLAATCHCGAVRIEIPWRPRILIDCNCSICRRYGTLWAYYKADTVRVHSARGATAEYAWGDRTLRFVRCAICGCVTHWEPRRRKVKGRIGVNARNFEPSVLASVRIRRLDGASTWKYLD
jgi:hypothetical protein